MDNWTTYQEFERELTINGHTITASVVVEVTEDDIDPAGDFDFGDETENVEYLERFQSGELFIGVIRVVATAVGETGTDYLGGCHLPAVRGDGGKEIGVEIASMVADHGMVANAIDELTSNIRDRAAALAKFA